MARDCGEDVTKGGGERREGGSGRAGKRGWRSMRLTAFLLVFFLCEATGWIALSKDGYKVTKDLLLINGSRIEGDILIKGVIHSSNVTWLGPSVDDADLCDLTREGSLRWNSLSGDFEGCNGRGTWSAVRFCTRECGFSNTPLQRLRAANHSIGGPAICSSVSYLSGKGSFCEDAVLQFDGWSFERAIVDSKQWRRGRPDAKTSFYSCGSSPVDVRDRLILPMYDANSSLVMSIVAYTSRWDETPAKILWERPLNDERASDCATLVLEETDAISTPWLDSRVTIQNEPQGPSAPLTTCAHFDFNSSAFDFLRIFYNVSGWESLLPLNAPNPLRLDENGLVPNVLRPPAAAAGAPTNVTNATNSSNSSGQGQHAISILDRTDLPTCVGARVFGAPWVNFLRGTHRYDARGTVKSGPYGVNQTANYSIPTACSVQIQAPLGFRLRLSFLFLDLAAGDWIMVRERGPGESEWSNLANISANLDAENLGVLPVISARGFGWALELSLSTNINVTNLTSTMNGAQSGNETLFIGEGYILSYDYVARLSEMVQIGNASLLQYSLAMLEIQGINMRSIGWHGWPSSSLIAPPGYLSLGSVTEAENCFLCCFIGQDYEVAGDEIRKYYEQRHLENAPILPSWNARPSYASDLGAAGLTATNFDMAVGSGEIPPVVGYMGYKPKHFIRSHYVSRFPPGSVKLPYGAPLGKRTAWSTAGPDDPSLPLDTNVPREQLGWELHRVLLQPGGNFTDRDNHGWGRGWGDGSMPGDGTQWRDFDGASANWFPAWQIAIAAASVSKMDKVRWDVDLDHEDVALFSFVDHDRRIVFANDLALSVSCGVKINNTCGISCEILGTGLNLLQCMANIPKTSCSQPVADDCNNECGVLGSMDCAISARGLGAVRVHSKVDVNATANYGLSVGLRRDPKDGLVRIADRTKNDLTPNKVAEGGWASEARPFSVPDPYLDNSLYISHHDPSEDVDYVTIVEGQEVTLTLTKAQMSILSSKVSFDLPLPIECPMGPSICATMSVVDDLALNLRWINRSSQPYWDLFTESKTADYREMRQVIERNAEILKVLFIADCMGTRAQTDPTCSQDFNERMGQKLLRLYGRQIVGTTRLPCSLAIATSQCAFAMDDLQFMLTDLERRRTIMMASVASRPRFDMAKISRLGGPGGLDFGSPDPTTNRSYNHNTNTMLISTDLELIGDYIRLGSSRFLYKNFTCHEVLKATPCGTNQTISGRGRSMSGTDVVDSGWVYTVTPDLDTCPEKSEALCSTSDLSLCDITNCSWALALDVSTLSHVFMDGEIDKECPFSFNGGQDAGGRLNLCVQTGRLAPLTRAWEAPIFDPLSPRTTPKDRVITLPDATGRVVLTTLTQDLQNLRGLRKRNSFTPYRYAVPSPLDLDDNRQMPGETFWNKKFGASHGLCGKFDDGLEIVCPPLKLQYDAIENSQNSMDPNLIFTGNTILQGRQFTDVKAPIMPPTKVECSHLHEKSSCSLYREGVGGLTLVSKKMYVCLNSAGTLPGPTPNFCDPSNPRCTPGQGCNLFPIWDLPPPYNSPEAFNKLTQPESLKRVTYLLPVNLREEIPTTCDAAAVQSQKSNSKYAFLQIFHGLSKARTFVELLQGTQGGPGLAATSSPLYRLAMTYLDLQGVSEIVSSTGSIYIAEILKSDSSTIVPWGASLFEQCMVCCAPVADKSKTRLMGLSTKNDSSCAWMNVSSLVGGAAAEGQYHLQNYSSFGRPVWKQEPGETYIYFLRHACIDPVLCGNTLQSAEALRGPAWVAGTTLGGSRFHFYVLDPYSLSPFKLLSTYSLFKIPEFGDLLEFEGYFTGLWRQLATNGAFVISMPDLICSTQPYYRFATTAVNFVDPQSHRKLTFPSAHGRLLTTGTLEDISALGLLVSPIVGANSVSQSTRVKFGLGWQTVNVLKGVNDVIDYSWTAGDMKYCWVPKSSCILPTDIGPFVDIDEIPGCPLPVIDESLAGCMFPAAQAVTGKHGLDAVMVAHKNDGCISLYLTDEFFVGAGSFEQMATSKCLMQGEGVPLPVLAAEYLANEMPRYWGLDPNVCQQQFLSQTQCIEMLQAGCRAACLRQRDCVVFRLDQSTRMCMIFLKGCAEVPGSEPSSVLLFRKLSGGWQHHRFVNATLDFLPEIGSRVLLGQSPERSWYVDAIYSVCDRDPLGISAEKCAGRKLGLQISANLTTKKRYVMCSAAPPEPELGDDVWTRLQTDLPYSPNSNDDSFVKVLNQTLSNFSYVRIADDVFQVLGNDGDPSGLLLRRAKVSFNATSHQIGDRVYGVVGGLWNSTWSEKVVVPQGVYTLENLTSFINSRVEQQLESREVYLSLNIREPDAGLCGEVPHGVSYDVKKFHCAPGSRFLQLTGGIKLNDVSGVSNHIRVFNTSTLLPSLGIALPLHAYTFASPDSKAFLMTPKVTHPTLSGAGFISSRYGRESGFGLGGQDGWVGFMPPGANETTALLNVRKVLWCNYGMGYRCVEEPCGCRTTPVLTNEAIYGSTLSQKGAEVTDNTLLIPRGSDGVLVSTGNLEDIGLDSSSFSSLSINAVREHATGVAAHVHGMVEFGKCNSIFGNESECSLDSSVRNGISLMDSDGKLSLHTSWKRSLWAAVYTLPEHSIQTAANHRDFSTFWKLFLQDPTTVNRTWSSLQDATAIHVAGRLCKEYCSWLDDLQRREAAELRPQVASIMPVALSSPIALLADATPYCYVARCPTTNAEFYTDSQNNRSTTLCRAVCSTACVCSQFRSCSEIWGGAARTYAGNEGLWLQCVQLLENQADVTPTATAIAQAQQARYDFSIVAPYWKLLAHYTVQNAEAQLVCSCAEIPGYSEDVQAKVDAHECPYVTLNAVDGTGKEFSPVQNVSARVCVSNYAFALRLGQNGTASVTTLNFLSKGSGIVEYLTIPSTSGVLLTSGNLDAVTQESGAMTSVRVQGPSEFSSGFLIGHVGSLAKSRGSRAGNGSRTTVHSNVSAHCEACEVAGTCDLCQEPEIVMTVNKSFITVSGSGNSTAQSKMTFDASPGSWTIDFPAWDDELCVGFERDSCKGRDKKSLLAALTSTVITTGNLADISHLNPQLVDSSGDIAFLGPVEFGSGYDCKTKEYPLARWSVYTRAHCTEVEEVDWNSSIILPLNVSECKEECEKQPWCGVAITKAGLDRGKPDARCHLVHRRASECTVVPKTNQDLYLLYREGPSPWLTQQGNTAFFDKMCTHLLNNVTKIPGVGVRIDGFLNGGLTWRPSTPLSWTKHTNMSCSSFEGSMPRILRIFNISKIMPQVNSSNISSPIQNLSNSSNISFTSNANYSNYSNRTNQTNHTNYSYTQPAVAMDEEIIIVNMEYCKQMCELDPACKIVSFSHRNQTCTLMEGVSDRRVMFDWSVIEGACWLEESDNLDTYQLARNESIRLNFQPPSKKRQLSFADANGVIITTGNTYDIQSGIGLAGKDVIGYSHTKINISLRLLDTQTYFDSSKDPDENWSEVSGREPGLIVRECALASGCRVISSSSVDEVALDKMIYKHVTRAGRDVNSTRGPRGERGKGDGYDHYRTIVDVAEAGSRLGDKECLDDCKGRLPCQRGTPTCHKDCPGWMLPQQRFGITADDYCLDPGKNVDSNSKGDRCGCAGGWGYGKFGTGVCVMPDKSHPMHGAFCQNTSSEGLVYELDSVSCCMDPRNSQTCGLCKAFAPQMAYGKANRITFPEASGVVLTTGNIDSLSLTDVQLESLDVEGSVHLGVQDPSQDFKARNGAPDGFYTEIVNGVLIYRALVDFHPASSIVTGGLRWVDGWGDPDQRYGFEKGNAQWFPYTMFNLEPHTPLDGTRPLPSYQKDYCIESVPYESNLGQSNSLMDEDRLDPKRCFKKREISLPDVSGEILSTGSLQNLASVAIPRDGLFLEGWESQLTVMGNLTLGRRVNYADDPSNNIDGADNGHRSLLTMHSIIDGDIGLTFQSAGDYLQTWEIHREIDTVVNYGKYGGGAQLGGPAPTDEVTRFAAHGRERPMRERLWERDTIKINLAVLGGVDHAIRAFLRDGSPSLAVTVQDEHSLDRVGTLRDHSGYLAGRPVLQQRPGAPPGLGNTYPPFNADIPSFIGNSAVKETSQINAEYCRAKLLDLQTTDPATGSSGASYYHLFSTYLVKQSLVVPTLLTGRLLKPPPYDSSRLDQAPCLKFADDTRNILEGQSTMWTTPSARIPNAITRTLRFTSSSQSYRADVECLPLEWNNHLVEADFVRYNSSSCGGKNLKELPDLISVDECAKECLKYGKLCKGYTMNREPKHLAMGLAGNCYLAFDKCDPIVQSGEGNQERFADTMIVAIEIKEPETRACATDYDFSSSDFDAMRQYAGILPSDGLGAFGLLSEPESCYACCALQIPSQTMTERALDGDLATFLDYHSPSGCFIVLDLGMGVSSVVRTIRFAPRKGYSNRIVGGRFQGSNISMNEGFDDIFVVEEPPKEAVYTEVRVENSGYYRWLRYLAPDDSFCSVAEVEFHSAFLPTPLSPVQAGTLSYILNRAALEQDPAASELVKCASHGLFPAWLDNSKQEIILPEANGHALTTGSLSDITLKSGEMTSVSVAGDMSVGGSAILGSLLDSSWVTINSGLVGQSVFRFQGEAGEIFSGESGGIFDVGVIKTPGEKFVQMPDSSGMVVVGELPPVMRGMLVLPDGSLDITWTVTLGADTRVKSLSTNTTSSLQINSALTGSFPISFDGSVVSPAQTSFSSPDPTIDSVVTFPDVSGTIITTGSMPAVMSNITSIRGARMQGGAKFLGGDVNIGEAERPVSLDIYAHILGTNSLIFDGSSRNDGRTLILSADDPQGENHLTLPDTSGTIITSGNFPSVFERLQAVGNVSVSGGARIDSRLVRIGLPGGNSKLSVPATIKGRFPLTFDGGLAADTEKASDEQGPRTVLMMPESSRDNVITFPDTSGDVVTTTTIPTRQVTSSEYRIKAAKALVLSTSSLTLGRPCTDDMVEVSSGSFIFYDKTAGAAGFRPRDGNMFMAYASGGFRFVTGRTSKARFTGAVLKPNASAWSYLSDKRAKTQFSAVNATDVLETLISKVKSFRWQYSGGGDSSFHMGPMAQDLYDAFGLGNDRAMIGTSDMDGVLLSAVQGMHNKIVELEGQISKVEEALKEQMDFLQGQTKRLHVQQVKKAYQAQRLDALVSAVSMVSQNIHPH